GAGIMVHVPGDDGHVQRARCLHKALLHGARRHFLVDGGGKGVPGAGRGHRFSNTFFGGSIEPVSAHHACRRQQEEDDQWHIITNEGPEKRFWCLLLPGGTVLSQTDPAPLRLLYWYKGRRTTPNLDRRLSQHIM